MCELEELTRECGAATPGIAKLYGIDIDDIISIPIPNADLTVTGNIVLKDGKYFKEIPFVEGKAGLTDDIADAVGGGFRKSLPITLPKYSPKSNRWVNSIIGARIVVIVVDNNDQMIIVGSKLAGVRLEKATGNTGQKTGDQNGWDLNLVADGVKPCYFYTGAVALADATPTTFDHTLTFVSSHLATVNGVTAAIGSSGTVSALKKLEFDNEDVTDGLSKSMSITLGGVEQMTVDYTDNRNGKTFRFTDGAGVTHVGVFTDPVVAF